MKPLLKWIGGKTNILTTLFSKIPTHINNYHEIFIGGGSVLLEMLMKKINNEITIDGIVYAYDLNETLIYFYKNIQQNPELFYTTINEYIEEYNSCDEDATINRNPEKINIAKLNKENYYYWLRNKFNKLSNDEKKTMNGSALFLMLNKLCFRGMYRVNKSGGFNVPYGNYSNPEIINKQHLLDFSAIIQDVIFEVADFTISLTNFNRLQDDDFVYCDPPYVPEKITSFVGYNEDGFNGQQHLQLFNLIKDLNEKNIKFMLSNSHTTLVKENFENYTFTDVLAKRAINSKNPASKITELLITNFE